MPPLDIPVSLWSLLFTSVARYQKIQECGDLARNEFAGHTEFLKGLPYFTLNDIAGGAVNPLSLVAVVA